VLRSAAGTLCQDLLAEIDRPEHYLGAAEELRRRLLDEAEE